MTVGSAWPMIKVCMEQQGPWRGQSEPIHAANSGPTEHFYVGCWIGRDHIEHDDYHNPGDIVAMGRPYESPNLVLWNGTRHQVVLTLIEESD